MCSPRNIGRAELRTKLSVALRSVDGTPSTSCASHATVVSLLLCDALLLCVCTCVDLTAKLDRAEERTAGVPGSPDGHMHHDALSTATHETTREVLRERLNLMESELQAKLQHVDDVERKHDETRSKAKDLMVLYKRMQGEIAELRTAASQATELQAKVEALTASCETLTEQRDQAVNECTDAKRRMEEAVHKHEAEAAALRARVETLESASTDAAVSATERIAGAMRERFVAAPVHDSVHGSPHNECRCWLVDWLVVQRTAMLLSPMPHIKQSPTPRHWQNSSHSLPSARLKSSRQGQRSSALLGRPKQQRLWHSACVAWSSSLPRMLATPQPACFERTRRCRRPWNTSPQSPRCWTLCTRKMAMLRAARLRTSRWTSGTRPCTKPEHASWPRPASGVMLRLPLHAPVKRPCKQTSPLHAALSPLSCDDFREMRLQRRGLWDHHWRVPWGRALGLAVTTALATTHVMPLRPPES